MKKSILITGALLVLGASAASAEGINLSWTDCGLAGQLNRTFACNVNTAGNVGLLVASFDPPPNVNQLVGFEGVVDISTARPALPDWWKHGVCATRFNVGFDFEILGLFSCDGLFNPASGGFAATFVSADKVRLTVQAANSPDLAAPVAPGTEYYAFRVGVTRALTTGIGLCEGCLEPACIVLQSIQLFQPLEAGYDPTITNPRDRNYVTWQSAPPGCPLSTDTKSRTWGQVKSLYR